jgi:hypothetical protein
MHDFVKSNVQAGFGYSSLEGSSAHLEPAIDATYLKGVQPCLKRGGLWHQGKPSQRARFASPAQPASAVGSAMNPPAPPASVLARLPPLPPAIVNPLTTLPPPPPPPQCLQFRTLPPTHVPVNRAIMTHPLVHHVLNQWHVDEQACTAISKLYAHSSAGRHEALLLVKPLASERSVYVSR